jgi:NitT/TauT family transport system substrate-binding protein
MGMFRRHVLLLAAAATVAVVGAVQAQEPAQLILNYIPTADHAPYYYAKAQHWYEQAGIDLTIEVGKGSAFSAQAVGSGAATFGISDLATTMVARGKGADLVAVMNVYANSPQGFYWLKSSGIKGPQDFPGHSIGNPPGDAARIMWPAFAKAAHLDPASVHFVNIAPSAKIASLRSHAVDIITDFYNEHDLKLRTFGDDLGFQSWRSMGINLYGNSIIVERGYLAAHHDMVQKFVRVSQRAFAACVADVDPCLDALFASASGLDRNVQRDQWNRIKELMRSPTGETVALGAFDLTRVASDEDLVKTYIGLDAPFSPSDIVTNDLLDDTIKLKAE